MTTLLLLLLPSMLFLAGVFALPLVRYLWLSFHADSVMTGLVAIPNDGANWNRFFHDLRYWQDLVRPFDSLWHRSRSSSCSDWQSRCCSTSHSEDGP